MENLPPSWKLFTLTERAHIPVSMVLELTRRCHLHCVHCYLNETQLPNTPEKLRGMRRGELSAGEWDRVFEELAEAGCMYLVLTGGEIFLRSDLMQIIASARSRSFNVKLFTTAMHVNRGVAEELARLGVDRVEVSIYGGPQAHAKVTLCESAFERSLQGVRHLRQAGVGATIKGPLMTLNASEYEEVMRLAGELDCQFKFDPTVVPRNDGNKDVLQYRLKAEKLDAVFGDPRLISQENIENAQAFDDSWEGFLCSAGRNAGAMDPYGNVYPCLQWLQKAGNVRERSFREIWWGSPVLQKIRAMKAVQKEAASSCESGGGYCNNCPGLSELENGDPLKPALVLYEMEGSERKAERKLKDSRTGVPRD